MNFLVQIKLNKNGTIDKGTSAFDTMKEALIQFHVAMSSAMNKEDVKKFTCVILNENGIVQKSEVYEDVSVVETDI